ncbi:hypothetical protein VW098_12250 [Phaeobacter sp. JH57H2]|uniref:hypothetical protein n=1 Tax=unclassified Phaeobacter TaxID=2621772 RepID=UPI003A8B16E5
MDLMTCQPGDLLPGVVAENTEFFSYIPVVNEGDHIIGLLRAEEWFVADPPSCTVADVFEPLSERQVIGSDASIFDFIRTADERPIRLVVSGGNVSGLVSLSDLQQLPVRAALFTLVTSLEIVMAKLITRHWEKPGDWMAQLSEGRRRKLEEMIVESKERDSFVGEIAFTQLADKATLIAKGEFLSRSKNKAIESLRKIQQLRDDLAHANSYANSPGQARHVCDVVRDLLVIKTELLGRLSE